jgi:hypothetical protein
MFDGRGKGVSVGAQCRRCRVADVLGRGSGLFGSEAGRLRGFAQVLLLVPELFERFTTLLVLVARFLGESSELFGFIACRFGRDTIFFRVAALLFGVLAPGLPCLAHAVGFEVSVLGCALVARHS